ncbi:hypothetical protein [Agrobacterium sp. SUL3]|uniref:hypothetical protein n=1 Tax=Agrobacterium sp. SUL3 TaxID=1701910 RepID=UPI000699A309|nr:hypothetical protein [Agrobacterium sp. SUL3]
MGREELLRVIADYQRRLNIPDAMLGQRALNDASFVRRLRDGRRVWPDTAKKVVDFLEALEEEQNKLSTICTEDGTWIALDKRTGLAHSGRTEKAATANLRKKLEQQVAQ